MIRCYHTSDLHDHRGFSPRIVALRTERPGLLFDCGDALRGSQSIYHRSEPVIGELDRAGYDAQAMGNREFHYLFPLLAARARRMRHPLVCSNLVDTRGRTLPFASSLILQPPGDGARNVHVLGLLVVQYPTGSRWERIFGWRFLPPFDVVSEYARSVPEGEILIVLSHLGLHADRVLAAAVQRIDLILGGHSHDTLFVPERVGEVPIVHAGPYGRYVSRTELEYDATRARCRIADFALLPLLGPP